MMRKIVALIELKIVFILAILCIWMPNPAKKYFGYAGMAIILLVWLLQKKREENWRTFRDRQTKELGLVHWVLALAAISIFIGKSLYAKHLLGYIETPKIILFLIGYFGWAFLQMLILNGFFTNRLKECGLSDTATACFAGTIFGALHLPNPVLVPITFLGGIALAYIFLKWRNLYVLAVAQVLVATIVFYTISPDLHHNFRVGPGYFTWVAQNQTPPH